jgi:4-amino-4-deoxy-L-arabinose transferase-like glycosyltransferase
MTSFGANNAPGATARTPSQGSRGFNRGGGIGMNEGGERGVLRMFNQQMAGQDSWLLPLALFGILILLLKLRKPPRGDQSVRETSLRNLLLWGGWVLVMAAYFSVAGFFHRYYISMLAPGVAALAGIGLLEMCGVYRGKGWKSCLLPASIIVTAVVQCVVLSRYNSWARVLVPIIYLLAGGSSAALILLKAFQKNNLRAAMAACVVAGVAALLISPAIWSYTPILYGSQTSTPYAGPELGGSSYGGGMGNNIGGFADRAGQDAANQKLIDFLLKNNSGEKFIVAVPNASSAEPIILQTGKAVMSVGGFMGNDNILTVGSLAGIVKKGELR